MVEIGYIMLGAVVVLLVAFIILRNSFIGKRNQIESVFSTIDIMLKKRYDLLPNLVAVVKQYMMHERELLKSIAEFRSQAKRTNTGNADQRVALDNSLTSMLWGFIGTIENYPELKANEQVDNLMRGMNEIEEQIAAARRAYNAAVLDYNNSVEMFPTSIIASMMNFKRRNMFEISSIERQMPIVKDMIKAN